MPKFAYYKVANLGMHLVGRRIEVDEDGYCLAACMLSGVGHTNPVVYEAWPHPKKLHNATVEWVRDHWLAPLPGDVGGPPVHVLAGMGADDDARNEYCNSMLSEDSGTLPEMYAGVIEARVMAHLLEGPDYCIVMVPPGRARYGAANRPVNAIMMAEGRDMASPPSLALVLFKARDDIKDHFMALVDCAFTPA